MSFLEGVKATDEIGHRCLALLKIANTLEPEEFNACVFELSMQCLDDYAYKSLPEPPQRLHDYKSFAASGGVQTNKRMEARKLVYSHQEVKRYLEKNCKVLERNIANAEWLEGMLELWREWECKDRFRAVWEKYKQYPSVLTDLKRNVRWRKNLNWGSTKLEKSVKVVQDVFGGEIVDAR